MPAVTLPGMIKRIVTAAFLLCLLAACGNKGPLVKPSPESAQTTPASASADGIPARR